MESFFTRPAAWLAAFLLAWHFGVSAQVADVGPTRAVEPCQSRQTGLWGLCLADGSNAPPVVEQAFEVIGSGSTLFPARRQPGDAMGFIDVRGRWAIAPQYREARAFSDGLAVVVDGSRSAAIDGAGKLMVPWFDGLLFGYSQGLACFVPGGKIEHTLAGQLRQRLFGTPGEDPFGRAWWNIEGKVGFLDTAGRAVIAPQYEPKLNFLVSGCAFGQAGYAVVRKDGREGLIDRTGRWVVQPDYEYLGLVFSGNRKVVAMVADHLLKAGVLLNTVERLDGSMVPGGPVRWRETGPPREEPVAGGLGREVVNRLLFPRWQQDLLKEDVSSDTLFAWVGSLVLAVAVGLAIPRSRRTRSWPSAKRRTVAVVAAALALPVSFLAGLLSIYGTCALLMIACAVAVRAGLRRRRV